MDEDIKTEKKLWQKPGLIVLVRSQPEEAVLATCKYSSKSGPSTGYNGCQTYYFIACGIPACSTQHNS
jgi:hypothetical protein